MLAELHDAIPSWTHSAANDSEAKLLQFIVNIDPQVSRTDISILFVIRSRNSVKSLHRNGDATFNAGCTSKGSMVLEGSKIHLGCNSPCCAAQYVLVKVS